MCIVYLYVCICVFLCVCEDVDMCEDVCVFIWGCVCVRIYVWDDVREDVCVYVCEDVCALKAYVYRCTSWCADRIEDASYRSLPSSPYSPETDLSLKVKLPISVRLAGQLWGHRKPCQPFCMGVGDLNSEHLTFISQQAPLLTEPSPQPWSKLFFSKLCDKTPMTVLTLYLNLNQGQ